MRDIIESGRGWRAVDYGDGVWDTLDLRFAALGGGIKQFFDGMELLGYSEFPLEHVISKSGCL